MEELIILLSLLMISGAYIPSVIAASFHEKQEIFNLPINDNLGNLDRNKRSDQSHHLCNVSHLLKHFLGDEYRQFHKEDTGEFIDWKDFTVILNLVPKSIHEMIPNGVIVSDKKLIASDSTTVTNADDFEQKISSSEIILRTTKTETYTISNTFELSGGVKLPPLLGAEINIGFKFTRSATTTKTTSEEISRKLPSQQVTLKPHTSKRIISNLYASKTIHKYMLSFELDETSTFTIVNHGFGADIVVTNLKEYLIGRWKSEKSKYLSAIYDETTPCVEYKDNTIYMKYFHLEVEGMRTELDSIIEDNKLNKLN